HGRLDGPLKPDRLAWPDHVRRNRHLDLDAGRQVKGEAAAATATATATADAQDSATDSLAVMSLERRRAGMAALPARLPTAAHAAGRDRTAGASSERNAPQQPKRVKAEPNWHARKTD
ncbi:hypothetical protein OC844_007881, partial [Tilletia horrida]